MTKELCLPLNSDSYFIVHVASTNSHLATAVLCWVMLNMQSFQSVLS